MLWVTVVTDGAIAAVLCGIPAYFVWRIGKKEKRGWLAFFRRHDGAKKRHVLRDAALAAVWLLTLYACFIAPRQLVTREYKIALSAKTGAVKHGAMRIAVVSDLHLGVYKHADWTEKIAAAVNAQHPDVVLLGGDMASVPEAVNEFAPLAAIRARYGVFAVLGNWDYRAGAVDVRQRLGALGIRTLVNRSVMLGDMGMCAPGMMCGAPTGVRLAGLDDIRYGTPDWIKAMDGAKPEDRVIALVHNPDFAPQGAPHGVDLMVAGHTHCGQVRLPLLGEVAYSTDVIGHQYECGAFDYGPMKLFITPGAGESSARARLLDAPEVSVVDLSY